jgi:hypothetical protein
LINWLFKTIRDAMLLAMLGSVTYCVVSYAVTFCHRYGLWRMP